MKEISCAEVYEDKKRFLLVDVRTPEEFHGELGHIAGAKLVTLGPDLMKFLESQSHQEKIIFVCRSGARSGQTTLLSEEMGFQDTHNMVGGMLEWNRLNLPIVKE